jgi:hypothetical protein
VYWLESVAAQYGELSAFVYTVMKCRMREICWPAGDLFYAQELGFSMQLDL